MRFIAISASLLIAVGMVAASSIAQLKSDIQAIDSGVVNLYQHCQTEQLSLFSALAIKTAADDLTTKINAGSKDAQALNEKLGDADAKSLIKTLADTETRVKITTGLMAKLKPQFDKLRTTALALSTINQLQEEVKDFGERLISICPQSTRSAAKQLSEKYNTDLANCAEAYQNTSSESEKGDMGSQSSQNAQVENST
ncbi:uncharacterized protein MEPE_00882 [Melanopsichium pennsylvanicum]|uniref:Cell wall protein n=2 Tax=Melanopsichium pennsylvanicum TaxID=63383 RepID=A0AAJ4XHM5_9BASI|nr:conserved hypothetical protein [Melanopsichium pennsylvanicum 4]SNX82176.1 uncharacterized protein MEPE_00882 [Melanopsichium pennsylvanicum]